jgi:hypothetical protein
MGENSTRKRDATSFELWAFADDQRLFNSRDDLHHGPNQIFFTFSLAQMHYAAPRQSKTGGDVLSTSSTAYAVRGLRHRASSSTADL